MNERLVTQTLLMACSIEHAILHNSYIIQCLRYDMNNYFDPNPIPVNVIESIDLLEKNISSF